MSAEYPLLCTDSVVRNILAGRQTEDRRPLRPQPVGSAPVHVAGREWWNNALSYAYGGPPPCRWLSPFGAPGDLLYVREAWRFPDDPEFRADGEPDYVYACDLFDGPGYPESCRNHPGCDSCEPKRYPWRPNIHHPKRLARIWLRVEEVGVQRVQDITTCSIVREGLRTRGLGWDANPWVWWCRFSLVSTTGRPS